MTEVGVTKASFLSETHLQNVIISGKFKDFNFYLVSMLNTFFLNKIL